MVFQRFRSLFDRRGASKMAFGIISNRFNLFRNLSNGKICSKRIFRSRVARDIDRNDFSDALRSAGPELNVYRFFPTVRSVIESFLDNFAFRKILANDIVSKRGESC